MEQEDIQQENAFEPHLQEDVREANNEVIECQNVETIQEPENDEDTNVKKGSSNQHSRKGRGKSGVIATPVSNHIASEKDSSASEEETPKRSKRQLKRDRAVSKGELEPISSPITKVITNLICMLKFRLCKFYI